MREYGCGRGRGRDREGEETSSLATGQYADSLSILAHILRGDMLTLYPN